MTRHFLRSPDHARVAKRRVSAAAFSPSNLQSPVEMYDYILETASGLFYEHGLRAVGIDLVIREAGVAKATLYRHFPTKELLVLAYLERRGERALAEIRQTAEDAGPLVEDKVAAIFSRLHQVAQRGFRGCAFVRAMAEHIESPEIHAAVRQHKDAIREIFLKILKPSSGKSPRREDEAGTLALIYDGALATAMVQQRPNGVLLAKAAALRLLAS